MQSTKDREKIRQELEKEIKENAVKAVESAGKKEGLSQDIINNIKKALS
jgi:predicted small metal-binding protein